MSAEELRLDLSELQQFLSASKRANVKNALSSEIKKIEAILAKSASNGEQTPDAPSSSPVVSASSSSIVLPMNKISTYAYDQSDKYLKLYVTVPNVNNVPADRVTCDFQPKSIKMFARDVQGVNHELVVQGLLHPIDPKNCLIKIKKDMVLLMLKKQKEQNWSCVTEQEAKTSNKKPVDDPKKNADDPNASLMGLMKQMYDEGDDDMKRTIKKAWVESQEKKSGMGGMADMMGGGGGMGGMANMMGGMGMGGMDDL